MSKIIRTFGFWDVTSKGVVYFDRSFMLEREFILDQEKLVIEIHWLREKGYSDITNLKKACDFFKNFKNTSKIRKKCYFCNRFIKKTEVYCYVCKDKLKIINNEQKSTNPIFNIYNTKIENKQLKLTPAFNEQ